MQITASNRGPEPAELHLLPTLWFRNDWASWLRRPAEKPELTQSPRAGGRGVVEATHPTLGTLLPVLRGRGAAAVSPRTRPTTRGSSPSYPNAAPYVKDGINDYVVHGQADAVNPERRGTKVAAHYRLTVGPGQAATVRLRLSDQAPSMERSDARHGASLLRAEL